MKVAILGTGQLAALLTHAAYPLGVQTVCIAETDFAGILQQVKECDVITLENENISVVLLEKLQEYKPVYPPASAVAVAQERFLEKSLLQRLNIPTPPFAKIDSFADLEAALQTLGAPAVLKTRRFGYDGKGQAVIKNITEAAVAWQTIGENPAILEGFIQFDCEVSLIAARNITGEIVCYPLIKNTHQDGILRVSASPFENTHLQKLAENYVKHLFNELDYVGVLGFEFFVQDNTLIANEIAPRVHNSGHLTIEGFNVSQFENHLRAVLNLPLVKPILQAQTTMHNMIGEFPKLMPADYTNCHVYDYGKEPRPNRKLGHITEFKSL